MKLFFMQFLILCFNIFLNIMRDTFFVLFKFVNVVLHSFSSFNVNYFKFITHTYNSCGYVKISSKINSDQIK